jgi:DNA-directed RNA polymerase subunit M/transcription elongation factor TFIIS
MTEERDIDIEEHRTMREDLIPYALQLERDLPIVITKQIEKHVLNASNNDVNSYRRIITQILFALSHKQFKLAPEDSRFSKLIFRRAMNFTYDIVVEDKVAELERLCAEEGVTEGFMSCRCGSRKIDYENKHTRSADEGPTLFCICFDCGDRWRISS